MNISIGDKVLYRGAFGRGPIEEVIVEHIEKCEPGEKYGDPVDSISEPDLLHATFSMSNGFWAYGHQIIRKV